tara:strand:+ start:1691 stop:2194 length:504 start_codon:yes stop_codon:yes gene_type:complete
MYLVKSKQETHMFKYFFKISAYNIAIALVILTATSCAPSRALHGNLVTPDRTENLAFGKSTKDDVMRALGSPTSRAAFNDNIWYYIGIETTKQGFMDPKIKNKKVVLVAFDEQGALSRFENITEDGVDVPIVSRETPTHGTNLTVLEQLLGNVGRFNAAADQGQLDR